MIKSKDVPKSRILKYLGTSQLLKNSNIKLETEDTQNDNINNDANDVNNNDANDVNDNNETKKRTKKNNECL